MSNRSLLLPSSMSSAQRRATRPSRHPAFANLVAFLGRGWHTRRLTSRARAARMEEIRRHGLAKLARQLGWDR